MNDTQLETIEQIQTFLSGTQPVDLIIEEKAERYVWIRRTLVRLRYLIPVLKRMLTAFPIILQSFHSDNGSEYINK